MSAARCGRPSRRTALLSAALLLLLLVAAGLASPVRALAAPITTVHGIPVGWSNTDVTFSFTVDSDTASTHYTINSQLLDYVAPVTVSAEGTTSVQFYSDDLLCSDSVESPKTALIRIDKSAPVSQIGGVPAAGSPPGPFTFAISASDAYSGVAQTWYRLDGGAPQAYTKLADAATKLLFPDFTLDELEIGPGSYDAKTKYYTFDTYVVLMHLTADPTVKVARSYSITQAAADHLTRSEVTVKANRALEKVGGTSWLLYATDKVQPLVKGIKDQKYVALMKKVAADWPGGCIVMLMPDDTGKVTVRVFTWESYWKSPAEDYMEATYTESGGVWTIGTYDLFLKGQVVPSTDASGV